MSCAWCQRARDLASVALRLVDALDELHDDETRLLAACARVERAEPAALRLVERLDALHPIEDEVLRVAAAPRSRALRVARRALAWRGARRASEPRAEPRAARGALGQILTPPRVMGDDGACVRCGTACGLDLAGLCYVCARHDRERKMGGA